MADEPTSTDPDVNDEDEQAVAELYDESRLEDADADGHDDPRVQLVEPHPSFGLDDGFEDLATAAYEHVGLEAPEVDVVGGEDVISPEELAMHEVRTGDIRHPRQDPSITGGSSPTRPSTR